MRYSKYRAVPTFVNGIRFASKKEAARYKELLLLREAGEIKSLGIQVPFNLAVNAITIGKYIADFVYLEKGARFLTIEDVKGMRKGTAYQFFLWKKKHMMAQYGIEIREI